MLACHYVIVYVHHTLVVCHKAPVPYGTQGVIYSTLLETKASV